MIPICKKCLKLPVCKYKHEVICKDLVQWIHLNDTTIIGSSQKRINAIERLWGKELSVILSSGILKFKKEKDQYSCLVVKNM